MTGTPDSDDYAAGYADGVRDAAAWTAKRAADLVTLAARVPGDAGCAILAATRSLHDDAQTRWAQWYDRRNWPSIRALMARARRGDQVEGA